MPLEVRRRQVVNQIHELVGPDEVLRELGISSSAKEFADKILAELEDYYQKKDERFGFLNLVYEDRLTVFESLQASKFLILMTNIMQF
ncbi:MAG: hypothetical protein KDD22_05945 [Bdellovibrionales bacterium]|nr:hypothetical protein [Bdellovibrionales bacterium]